MNKYLIGVKHYLPTLNREEYILLPILPVDKNLFDMFEEVYLLDPTLATTAESQVRYFTITPDVKRYVKGIGCEEKYQPGFRRILKTLDDYLELMRTIKNN